MQQRVINSTEGVDSFDNPAPVQEAGAQGGQAQAFESFDDTSVILPENKDDQSGEEQEQTKEAKDSQDPEIKREADKLEDQEKNESDKEREAKSDDSKGEDKSAKEEESDREETSGDKPKGKTVRAKAGDEAIDIPLEATVPVKVKGKKEFVTLEELQKNYSGAKAWGEEIETVKAQKMEMEQEVEQFNKSREATKAHFAKIGGMLEDAFSNPEADPLAAMKYLVELGGRDVLEFEKRMMDHYGNLSTSFNEMSEAERELYWTRRHNDILKDSQASREREVAERKAQEERKQQVSQTMEKYGISEEEYNATEQELGQIGYDLSEVTPEQISHYAALKPLVAKAVELTSQFEDDLGSDDMDALVRGTADAMFRFPEIDEVEALRISAKRLGFEISTEDEMVDHLNEKTNVKEPVIDRKGDNTKRAVAPPEDAYESFDDFDELY